MNVRISNKFREILVRQNMSLRELAKRAGLSYVTVHSFCNNKKPIGPNSRAKIAALPEFQNHTFDDLFCIENDTQTTPN